MNKPILSWNVTDDVALAAQLLVQNKLIIGSTDTVFGFFSAATAEGVAALNKAKGRQNKPYILLASSKAEIIKHINGDQLFHIENILDTLWPGPLTIIFKAADTAPAYLCAADGTLSFRIPDHAGIQELLRSVPLIFSTSANRSGMPVACSVQEIDPELMSCVQAVIIDDRNNKHNSLPSTILDCSKVATGVITIVREGAITRDQISALVPVGVQLL